MCVFGVQRAKRGRIQEENAVGSAGLLMSHAVRPEWGSGIQYLAFDDTYSPRYSFNIGWDCGQHDAMTHALTVKSWPRCGLIATNFRSPKQFGVCSPKTSCEVTPVE